MRKMLIRNIVDEFKKSLKPDSAEEFFDIYFYRPIAFLFIKLIAKTNVSPNTVTVLGMIWGILAGYLLSKGTTYGFFYGALIYQFANIFDCADGQLARLKKNYSELGRILDGFVDYFNVTAVYIGSYIGFLKYFNHILSVHYVFFVMLVASISTILTSVVYDKLKTKYIEMVKSIEKTQIDNDQNSDLIDLFKKTNSINGIVSKNFFVKLLLFLYGFYNSVQNNLTENLPFLKNRKNGLIIKNKELYRKLYIKKNSQLLKLWGIVGPSAHAFYFFIFALLSKLFLYFVFIASVLNVVFVVLIVLQFLVNREINFIIKENTGV